MRVVEKGWKKWRVGKEERVSKFFSSGPVSASFKNTPINSTLKQLP